ncbi:hypothetical protein T492DRAFT_890358 [Pavlovales sp. CCMP2436]|nr:hypothetical protein T492DRAFT_890358 [Pavlovales sp. CCMP2436]
MQAWHTQGQNRCYICTAWYNLGKGRDIKNSFTEFEYLRLLHEVDECPDTGHIFDDCSPDGMMRKSPDRIDASKCYEPGNVRVVTGQFVVAYAPRRTSNSRPTPKQSYNSIKNPQGYPRTITFDKGRGNTVTFSKP